MARGVDGDVLSRREKIKIKIALVVVILLNDATGRSFFRWRGLSYWGGWRYGIYSFDNFLPQLLRFELSGFNAEPNRKELTSGE